MASIPSFSILTESLLPIVRQAGAAIMQHYHTDVAVVTKTDGSPTTAADSAAEAIITPALEALTPHIPVVAEEAVSDGHVPPVSNALWLVDPLDGTREFLHKTDEFTVNLGLVVDGIPLFGIIYAPALDRLFVGYADIFRRWEKGVEMPPISPPMYNSTALRVVGSRSHTDAKTTALLEGMPVVSNVSAGSSLKFCLVATGEADFYPRLGRTMEWDTAAGDAILRAVGGRVTTLDGQPLGYNKRARGFDNPSFIAARKELVWPLKPSVVAYEPAVTAAK